MRVFTRVIHQWSERTRGNVGIKADMIHVAYVRIDPNQIEEYLPRATSTSNSRWSRKLRMVLISRVLSCAKVHDMAIRGEGWSPLSGIRRCRFGAWGVNIFWSTHRIFFRNGTALLRSHQILQIIFETQDVWLPKKNRIQIDRTHGSFVAHARVDLLFVRMMYSLHSGDTTVSSTF